MLAAGCADRVHIAATDPTPPGGSIAYSPTVKRGLEISSRLVQGLGLSWVDRHTPRDMWPTTLEGELHRFQTLRHGLTNQLVPAGLTYRLTSPEARVNDAGGEIYRGYWAGCSPRIPYGPHSVTAPTPPTTTRGRSSAPCAVRSLSLPISPAAARTSCCRPSAPARGDPLRPPGAPLRGIPHARTRRWPTVGPVLRDHQRPPAPTGRPHARRPRAAPGGQILRQDPVRHRRDPRPGAQRSRVLVRSLALGRGSRSPPLLGGHRPRRTTTAERRRWHRIRRARSATGPVPAPTWAA